MVERLVRNEKVWGSNPHTSTIFPLSKACSPFRRKGKGFNVRLMLDLSINGEEA